MTKRVVCMAFAAVDRAGEVAAWTAAGFLALMMTLGVADVLSAWLFNAPLPGALEAAEPLLAMAAVSVFARDQRLRRHIQLDVWTTRLSAVGRRRLQRLGDILAAGFYGVLAAAAWRFAWASILVREALPGATAIPVYPAKVWFAMALSLMTAACLASAARPARAGAGTRE